MTRLRRPTRERSSGKDVRVLGVDVGRVITGEDPVSGASLLTSGWQRTPVISGALSHLSLLNSPARFDGRVYLISKAGPKVQERTRDWLVLVNFHNTTDIQPEKVYFVRERAEKAAVCRRLGVTDFIDDRVSVLQTLDSVDTRFLFSPDDVRQLPPGIVHVRSWAELGAYLRP